MNGPLLGLVCTFGRLRKIILNSSADLRGVDVVYSHYGSGEPIVLLHGFLEERSMWNSYAEKLTNDHRVICIDLLGHGATGCLGYVHSMEDQADAVLAVLAKENIERCNVVGHSMGGYVALALAERAPERMAKLMLFHSTSYPDTEEKKKDRERVIGLVQRNKDVYVKAAIPSLFAEQNRDRLSGVIDGLVATATSFSQQGIIANVRGMMERADRSAVLQKGRFQKCVVHGELDPIISLESIRQQAALDPNIRFELIAGIGHMGHLEAPETCFTIIKDFCG